jgi:putative ABC transport system permease protein
MLTQLNREFPTVSLLDIGAILKQVGQVLEQVSRALEVMVVLVTICGVLLLLAQVQVGMRQRHQELVVYRTLGAGKRLLRMTLWSEFALLGLVAGLVAAIGAETALAVLQTRVFDFPWEPDWRLWLILPLRRGAALPLRGLARNAPVKGQSAVPAVYGVIQLRDNCTPVFMPVCNILKAQSDNTHVFSSTKH